MYLGPDLRNCELSVNWNSGEITRLITNDESGECKVAIWRRKSRYYARFKLERKPTGGSLYKTESLKTGNFEKACDNARLRHAELTALAKHGLPIKQITVNQAIDRFIENYRTQLEAGASRFSEHMLRGYRKSVDTHWRRYMGTKLLHAVNVADLEGYESWRRSWAKKCAAQKGTHGNVKATLRSRTIQWELNAFKAVLRWHAQRGDYNGRAYEWRFILKERERRPAMSLDHYRILYRYMRTNEFLTVGKHDNDKRLVRHRQMLRTYILVLANTGLRVGEARYLTWADVTIDKNKRGAIFVKVHVSGRHSKTGKSRTVVGRDTAALAFERWRRFQGQENCGAERLIFCKEDGSPIGTMREGFKAALREAGVEHARTGEKYCIYSLRHFYITTRLQKAKVPIHKLALNCGTSVSMIERFYSDAIPTDYVDELTS